jgi:magnesium transporter
MKPLNYSSKLIEPYTLEELCNIGLHNLEELDPERLSKTAPTILSAFLSRLGVDDKRIMLRKLSEEYASAVLSEMSAEESAEIVSDMREGRALRILEDLEPDDAADVMAALGERQRTRFLDQLGADQAGMVKSLLKHSPDTAGGVMHPQVATVDQDMTIETAINRVRQFKAQFYRLFYIYVIDLYGKLIGVVSIRDLLFSDSDTHIREVMKTELQGVCTVDQDTESVAQKMADSNLYALPVIDAQGRLVGIIEHDDVIDILRKEATEDLQRMVGAGPDESIHDKVLPSVRKRIPWLIVNMFTASIVGGVVYFFRNIIEESSALASFIPILASVGGNVGAQTLAVTIRSLALGELHSFDSYLICFKEGIKGVLNGFIIGGFGCAVVYLLTFNFYLSSVVFIATTVNMLIAGTAGSFVPLLLRKLKFDPAQSASIFLTAITDSMSALIFLSLASWVLSKS